MDVFLLAADEFLGDMPIVPDVVDDLGTDEFDMDEVLVCYITDPSGTSLMAIAGAIVIDIGGPISHGAIVDGSAGTVTVVTPA